MEPDILCECHLGSPVGRTHFIVILKCIHYHFELSVLISEMNPEYHICIILSPKAISKNDNVISIVETYLSTTHIIIPLWKKSSP